MQNINISLDQTNPIICHGCGCNIFTEGVLLRKVSKILSGTSTDALIPIQIMYCTKCGQVAEETLPVQLKQQSTPLKEGMMKSEVKNNDQQTQADPPPAGQAKIIPFKS